MSIKMVRKGMRARWAAGVSFNPGSLLVVHTVHNVHKAHGSTAKQASAATSEVAGLSLIEMMFASGIVALTLSMVFGAVVSLSDVSQSAERRAIAVTHLATVLETLRSLPYEDLCRYDSSALEGLAKGETAVAECIDASGAAVPLPIPPGVVKEALPNPLRVRATITWTVGQGRILSMNGWALLARN